MGLVVYFRALAGTDLGLVGAAEAAKRLAPRDNVNAEADPSVYT